MNTDTKPIEPPRPETTNEWAHRAAVRELTVRGMPKQLATALLTDPTIRITNRERKSYIAARTRFFVSIREPKDSNVRAERKFREATWAQLHRWLTRATRRGRGVYWKFTRTPRVPENELRLKALNLVRDTFATTILFIKTEIRRRTTLCEKV